MTDTTSTAQTGTGNLSTTHLDLSAMLVSLRITRWAARKTDMSASQSLTDSANAEHGVARVTKDLLPRKHIKAINTQYDAALATLHSLSMPWSDDGRRLVPVAAMLGLQQKLGGHETKFWAAVAELQLAYEEQVAQARESLGDLFNAGDYPPASAVPSKFSFGWDVEPVPSSGDIRVDMPDSLRSNIEHRMDTAMQERLEAATTSLFQRVHDQLARVHRVMSAETPRVYDSLMGGIGDLIDTLPDMNLTNDPKLAKLARDLQMSFNGITTEDLRKDHDARDHAKSEAGRLLQEMGDLL